WTRLPNGRPFERSKFSPPTPPPPPVSPLALRVLELQPFLRPAGAVAGGEPLRHDALEAHLAGVPEHALAVVGEVLVEAQAGQTSAQDAGKRRLARLDRLAPQVCAVQLQQVEGVEEDMLARRLTPQPL